MREYCIVGGGPVGLGIGKCLAQADLPFTIYEAEKDLGGTWALGQTSGLVYKSTHLISSRKNTQFSDFPMPDGYAHYPDHVHFLAYLRELASHYQLYDRTVLETRVSSIVPRGDHCEVSLSSGETRRFSAVIVANGRLRKPIIPRYPGKFEGRTLHASEYKSPEVFDGQRVLVIGAGNSGCDIAVDAAARAEVTFHSMRRGYHYMPKFIHGKPTQDWLMEIGPKFPSTDALWRHVEVEFKAAGFDPVDYGLPKPDHAIESAHPIMNSLVLYFIGHGDIHPKPDVARFAGKVVEFTDGTREEIDLVLWATGYEMEFPFLDRSLRPTSGTPELFLGSIHREIDNLLFFGYINAASGLGNLLNCGGKFVADYLKARALDTRGYRILRNLVRGPDPELGRGRFLQNERHKAEVDLWEYIKALNFLRSRLGVA